jgi:hypothetical protein
MAQRWYVVRTVAGDEAEAEKALRALGFDAFVPMDRRLEKNRFTRKFEVVARALLPGYLFVLLDIAEPGALGEVMDADWVLYLLPKRPRREWRLPLPVREGVAEAIRASDIANSTVTLDDLLPRGKRHRKRSPALWEQYVAAQGPAPSETVLAEKLREAVLGLLEPGTMQEAA